MFASEHQAVRKLCHEDITNACPTPEIKVCSKQKIVYKLAKSQTLQKLSRKNKQKTKHQWKLQSINAPHSTSIKVSLWTKMERTPHNELFSNVSKANINYKLNTENSNGRYHEIGLSSMEWTKHETDLLLSLYADFGNRWSVILDRYNSCKPSNRPKRNITEIKQRYYHCNNLIQSFNNNHHQAFVYDPFREEKRRKELSKLLMRSHDDNIEISQTAQYYRKHNKLLRKKVNEMHKKRLQLLKQSTFIRHRQQMTTQQIQDMKHNYYNDHNIPFGSYQGYGVIIQDTLKDNNKDPMELPSKCIPKRVRKVKRYIQMIDDEYTKYKYELKLDEHKNVTLLFPHVDTSQITQQNKYDVHMSTSSNHNNGNNKKKKKADEDDSGEKKMEQLLLSSNPGLGTEMVQMIQHEMINQDILCIDALGNPKMQPMTNATRAMINVLREDYIKYYALQTLINDMKTK